MTRKKVIIWLVIFFGAYIWSAIQPRDYYLWFMESLPGVIGFVLLAITYKRFKFSELAYWLMLAWAIILFVGAHYMYTHMPFFDYIRDAFGHERNNFDKFAHIVQGVVPAVIFREFLIRFEVLKNEKWMFIIVVSGCLAFSALYEIVEWLTTFAPSEKSFELLGMQGYMWDSQTDMLYALLGAIITLPLIKNIHNRHISQLSQHTEHIKQTKLSFIPAFITKYFSTRHNY